MKNEIILFENQCVKLEVNMKDETVWLSQSQMAELFGKDIKTITQNKTIGIIICKQDNKYIIKYCSDKRIIARKYELF